MNNKDKLELFFGTDKADSTEETTNKSNVIKGNWGAEWLKARESSLLGGGIVSKPYSQSFIVYRAVRSIAENVPQAKYKIIDVAQDKAVGPENPLFQLFANPNRFMSRFEFWEAIASYLNLSGEVFIYPVPSVGQVLGRNTIPAELWVLEPKHVQHSMVNGRLAGWVYNGKESVPFEPDELIHLKLFNPDMSTPRGLSPLAAARNEMEADYSAARWNRVFFDNNATPDGVIEVDKDKEIAIEDLRKLRKMWYEKHGGVDRAHKTAFLLGGMTYKQMGISQRDMDFIEGRSWSRDAVLSVFGVHPFVAGFYDSGTVTRATAKEAKRLFWTGTLKPQLIRIEEKLAVKFFPKYAPGFVGKFDYSDVEELQEDYSESVTTAKELFSVGYSRNEVNRRMNLGMPKDDADGDVRYLPINLIEVGMSEEDEPDPGPDPSKALVKEKSVVIEKDKYRRQFIHFQQEQEKRLQAKIKRFLFSQRTKVLKLLSNGFKADMTPEQMEVLGKLRGIFEEGETLVKVSVEPIYRESMQEAGEMAYRNLGLEAERSFIINEELLKSRLNMIAGINNTVYESVRKQIHEGITAGEGIEKISDRVKSVFNTTSNRAKVIARTETASLMNGTTVETYRSEGIQQKQWISEPDARDSHQISGEIRPIGKLFSNGLMYPGDPSGSPENVINCRCSIAPVVEI